MNSLFLEKVRECLLPGPNRLRLAGSGLRHGPEIRISKLGFFHYPKDRCCWFTDREGGCDLRWWYSFDSLDIVVHYQIQMHWNGFAIEVGAFDLRNSDGSRPMPRSYVLYWRAWKGRALVSKDRIAWPGRGALSFFKRNLEAVFKDETEKPAPWICLLFMQMIPVVQDYL